jgi:hypothetical protein
VPHTIKLKELTPEWRRIQVTGEGVLGMGGMLKPMMQSLGSMFGGSDLAEAIYTRGATVRIGGEEFLVGYRLPVAGIDFAAIMAMGQGGGAPTEPPKPKPVTPDSDLSLVLVNLRAIAAISDIRPFDLAEAMKPSSSGLMAVFEDARKKAQSASALSNMKQLGLALMMYSQDYDEVLPPLRDAATLKKVLLPYVRNEDVFKSPGTGQPFLPNSRLSGRPLRKIPSPATTVALYSAVPEPTGGRILCFVDGHAKAVGAREWEAIAAAQKLPADGGTRSDYPASPSSSQQRAAPRSAKARSGGIASAQRANAWGQRGWKGQPAGMRRRSGGWPPMTGSGSPGGSSRRVREASSARV